MSEEKLKIIQYTYFVTFEYLDKDLNAGIDNTQVTMYKQIHDIDDIRDIENSIQNELDEDIIQVVVTNFILLRTDRVEIETPEESTKM